MSAPTYVNAAMSVPQVYVHLLQDPAAAEDYCQRIYSANLTQQTVEDARESADIYLTLLEVAEP